jgi:hypothetical protein
MPWWRLAVTQNHDELQTTMPVDKNKPTIHYGI